MIPHVEFKVIDTATVNNPIGGVGGFFLLNGSAQGLDLKSRTGNTWWNKSVQLNIVVARNALTAEVCDLFTIMLVWDKDPDNVTPVGAALQTSAGALTHRNLNNRDRWLLLKKWTVNVNVQRPCWETKLYKRFSLRTVASQAGADITAIRSGALWLYAAGDAQIAGDEPKLTFTSRVRFTDA